MSSVRAPFPSVKRLAAEQPPDLIDARGVARRLNCCRKTVAKLVAVGVLPQPIRLSRKLLRWKRVDIERLLEKRVQGVA